MEPWSKALSFPAGEALFVLCRKKQLGDGRPQTIEEIVGRVDALARTRQTNPGKVKKALLELQDLKLVSVLPGCSEDGTTGRRPDVYKIIPNGEILYRPVALAIQRLYNDCLEPVDRSDFMAWIDKDALTCNIAISAAAQLESCIKLGYVEVVESKIQAGWRCDLAHSYIFLLAEDPERKRAGESPTPDGSPKVKRSIA